jgi:N-acetylmuramoyl-L-alanine amidase
MSKPIAVKFTPVKKRSKRVLTRINILFLLVNIAFGLLNIYCFYRFNPKHHIEKVETAPTTATVDSTSVAERVHLISEIDRTPTTKVPDKVIDNHFDVHTVLEGQTMYAISNIYKVPIDSIKKANNRTDNTIHKGEKLIIPKP